MSNFIIHRCEICSNIVALIKDVGGRLTCCEQEMTKLEPNTTVSAKEKHVPVVTKVNGKLNVVVGAILHPMLFAHNIEWIALDSGKKTDIMYLKSGAAPEAEFADAAAGTVYAYCNVHGLWKADF